MGLRRPAGRPGGRTVAHPRASPQARPGGSAPAAAPPPIPETCLGPDRGGPPRRRAVGGDGGCGPSAAPWSARDGRCPAAVRPLPRAGHRAPRLVAAMAAPSPRRCPGYAPPGLVRRRLGRCRCRCRCGGSPARLGRAGLCRAARHEAVCEVGLGARRACAARAGWAGLCGVRSAGGPVRRGSGVPGPVHVSDLPATARRQSQRRARPPRFPPLRGGLPVEAWPNWAEGRAEGPSGGLGGGAGRPGGRGARGEAGKARG